MFDKNKVMIIGGNGVFSARKKFKPKNYCYKVETEGDLKHFVIFTVQKIDFHREKMDFRKHCENATDLINHNINYAHPSTVLYLDDIPENYNMNFII